MFIYYDWIFQWSRIKVYHVSWTGDLGHGLGILSSIGLSVRCLQRLGYVVNSV